MKKARCHDKHTRIPDENQDFSAWHWKHVVRIKRFKSTSSTATQEIAACRTNRITAHTVQKYCWRVGVGDPDNASVGSRNVLAEFVASARIWVGLS